MAAERQLVEMLARTDTVNDGIRGLVGGVTATELQSCSPSDAARTALREGLSHPHPRVRWWCIQIVDHIDDPAAMRAVAGCLDDPVARVRRNAVHALTCEKCKPGGTCAVDVDTFDRIRRLASSDPSPKVRAEARRGLGLSDVAR